MKSTTKIAILGLGWLGLPLAEQLHGLGHEVIGAVSSPEKLRTYGHLPFGVCRVNVTEDKIKGDWESFLFDAEILIITMAPGKGETVEDVYPRQIDQLIHNTPAQTKVIFTSSTGVYANEGKVVDETSPTKAQKSSGRAVKNAEDKLRSHFRENLTVLRLGGLIGPERHPGRFLAGKRHLRNEEAPLNLVHREDVMNIIEKIVEKSCWGELFNVCASLHPIRKAYYHKAATVLQLDLPMFKTSDKEDFKIVDNTKSKHVLQYDYIMDDPEDIFLDKHPGKISIIGAGPGDKHLLTLKAYQLLLEAEVILHDNLVSEEILRLAPMAERCYVGRKFADKSDQRERQHRINELLHHHYKQGKKVARLKSGDPYVYGRAAEEARYLSERQVPFEVIPGISAALAAASLCNIPITERNHSNALMICTAHTADYSFEQLQGIAELLKSGNTLAIYMGLKSLDRLIPKLIEVCQDRHIPITAISNVSRENEKVLSSTLEKIRADINAVDLPMPVVFIVGAQPITPQNTDAISSLGSKAVYTILKKVNVV